MEKLKAWIVAHKAMTIGIVIALALLMYLWLSSRAAPAASGSSDNALAAYYGAQASSLQGAAAQAQSEDARLVASGQTAAAERVAIAQLKAPLEALAAQLNLVAYQDYLAESRGAGAANPPVPGTAVEGGTVYAYALNALGTRTLYTGGNAGAPLIERNWQTGEISINAETPGTWTDIPTGQAAQTVIWSGVAGEAPVAWSPPTTPAVLQWKEFVAQHGVQLGLPN